MKLSPDPLLLPLPPQGRSSWLDCGHSTILEEAQNENVDQWSNSTMKSLARNCLSDSAMKLWGILAGFIVGLHCYLLSVWCLVGVFFSPLGPNHDCRRPVNPPLNSDPAGPVSRSFSSLRFLGFVRRLDAGGAG